MSQITGLEDAGKADPVYRIVKDSMGSKKGSSKPKGKSKSTPKKPAPVPVRSSAKSRAKKEARPARTSRHTRRAGRVAESKRMQLLSVPEPAPRLLRETRATAAALALLEKGIKHIYQKEFKKARAEFKSLLENYPGESEILARARTYLQICEREDPTHKKPPATNDQLYNLGVLEHNRGDYEKAIAYFRQSLEKHPNSDHIHYSLAASYAMKGQAGEAVRHLQRAVELNDENRVFAKNDSDFASLQGQMEYGALVGSNPGTSGGSH